MRAGTSQVDITPAPGVELSGFAARTQPSVGVLDPLFANALHLTGHDEELLWIHCDLVGIDAGLVRAFRAWAQRRYGLPAERIILSASHTHSGPATIRLHACGQYDVAYGEFLLGRLQEAAEAARGRSESCAIVNAMAPLELAVDRRRRASAHTDPRVDGIGFRRADGSFVAAIVNYAMHPVALGASNRHISGDVPGQSARALAALLPGNPTVFATCGACGNLNPPALDVSPAQVAAWGQTIARAIAAPLMGARNVADRLHVRAQRITLPLEVLDRQQIEAVTRAALQDEKKRAAWGGKLPRVIEIWSRERTEELRDRRAPTRDVEVVAIQLGDAIVVGINAEVFSRCTDALRSATGRNVLVIGCANGVLGYLPTADAYAEGGYEVDSAHLFYGSFRFRMGALELLSQQVAALVSGIAPGGAKAECRPGEAPRAGDVELERQLGG